MMIVCTGRNGSIGQFMPAEVTGLKTRLEEAETAMLSELRNMKATALIHLAALTSVPECERDPALARALNVDCALKWLRVAKEAGIAHFVHVSTSHVFRPTFEAVWMDPERDTDAISVYGKTKAESEQSLLTEGAKLNMRVTVARVFSVIAPLSSAKLLRPGFLHTELLRRVRERDFSAISGYKNVRDFMDAASVTARLVSIAKSQVAQQVLHVCTGHPKSVKDLALAVFREHGIAENDMSTIFPENDDQPNFLISRPSQIEGEK